MSYRFKDREGREWAIALDAPTIKEVRRECGIDLCSHDDGVFGRLGEDPVLLVDVLWCLVRSQRQDVTDDQFGRSLDGDSIGSATSALAEAIVDFFPPRKRSLLRFLGERAKAMQAAMEEALTTTERTEISATIDRVLRSSLIGWTSAMSARESSASIPDN